MDSKFPVLRPGVNFFKIAGQDCSDIYVGFSNRGIELKFPIAEQLLKLFDGRQSLKNITSIIKVGQDQNSKSSDAAQSSINQILHVLSDERLIEFRTSALPSQLPKKELPAANLVNSLNRMRAEENLYSWHPQVDNVISAETLIGKRRDFSIMIYGRNRLALSLFAVLQASGFTQVKLTDRSNSASNDSITQIEPSDVCGLAIRGSDVGLRKALVLADLARNSQLFPAGDLALPALPVIPDLIISTESVPQETMQNWLSENIVHLPISNLIENKITIGPIVIPGKTPCLNCLNLWRAEQFPHHNSFEILVALDCGEGKGLELPAAQVALLTGLITTQVIQYCTSLDSGDSANSSSAVKLIGTTLAINLFDPIGSISSSDETFGYRYWQPHISCGCQRLI
jgi:hypothetical protein